MRSMSKIYSRFTVSVILLTLCALTAGLVPMGEGGDANARRKKSKKEMSGVVEGETYTDSEYNFKLTFPEEWNIRVSEKGSKVRVACEKKEYAVPMHFRSAEFHTTIPLIKVYIDTSSLDPLDFIDSLENFKFNSKQKEEIFFEFKVFDGDFVRPRVSRIRLENGITGRMMRTGRNYSLVVQSQDGRTGGVVQDQMKGDLAVFKRDDNTLIIISGECESQFYDINGPIFQSVVETLEFTDGDDS